MNDVIYIALTLLFLALTYGLIVLCERLMEEKTMTALYLIARPDRAGPVRLSHTRTFETGVVRMNIYSWLQLIFYFVVLLALAKPLGSFMARVYQGERHLPRSSAAAG